MAASDVDKALRTGDMVSPGQGAQAAGDRATTGPAEPLIKIPFTALESVRQKVQSGDPVSLTDQDRVELVAHQYLPVIVRSQKVGKISAKESAWDLAIELATDKFQQKYGRAPEAAVAGPRPATAAEQTVQNHLKAQASAVERVVIPTLTGPLEIERPTDPRKRAKMTQEFLPAAGKVAMDIGKKLVTIPEDSMQEQLAKAGLGMARGVGAMAISVSLLLPAHALGFISSEQLESWSKKLGG